MGHQMLVKCKKLLISKIQVSTICDHGITRQFPNEGNKLITINK